MKKIYTKKGDKGDSETLAHERVPKDSLILKVTGSIDECNAHLGVLIAYIKEDESLFHLLIRELEKIQHNLFCIGIEVSSMGDEKHKSNFLTGKHVQFIEQRIDWLWQRCPSLDKFIFPGGSLGAAYAHVCRSYARHVEREMVAWKKSIKTDKDFSTIFSYVNRLSDYFFALGRHMNAELGFRELTWPPLLKS